MKYRVSCNFLFLCLCKLDFVNASECLNKLNSTFESGMVQIDYISGQYKVSDKLGVNKDFCIISPKGFEKYLSQNFQKPLAENESIIYGWNYLSINKNVIYDYAKSLRDYLPDDSFSDATKYQLYSIINNKFACYSYTYDNLYQGSAAQNKGEMYFCTDTSGKNLNIAKLFDEQELVTKLIKTTYIQKILNKFKSDKSNIKTFKKLSSELKNDANTNCLLCGDTIPMDAFVIIKLNSNGTVDVKYNAWQNSVRNCGNSKPETIIFKGLHPKFKVSNYIGSDALH
ncbi:MAG: hypothetical protein PHC75_09375 [Burkholderiales bacterium]|nr:hypothetical protein [Burkholderiales bacterium]